MHLLPTLEVGGMETGVVNLGNRIDQRRFRYSICCLNGFGSLRGRVRDCVAVHDLGQPPGKAFGLWFRLAAFLRANDVDIVHTHNDYAGFYGVPAAKLARVPRIVHGEHGLTDWAFGPKRRAKTVVCALADCLTTVSAGLKEDVVKFWGVRPDKVLVLLNGVDQTRFSRPAVPAIVEGFGKRDGELLLGTVGRLSDQKDYPVLLEALASVAERLPNMRLLFVGDGPLREPLEAQARRLGLGERAVFLGERNDIPALLSLMDIFVLPSYTGEGIANCLLEAMSVGMPVIASNIKGNVEVVADAETGLLFAARDARDLADKIVRLGRDPELRVRLAAGGARRVGEVFAIDRMVENYQVFYARLMGQAGWRCVPCAE